ncbi:hypothetical protein LBMAG42_40740 [Deltaproteobacteria bacterium]|nr:hypothetical protein LBMAG42_40740 [Deltaproteobacteria bacterium]
MGLVVAIGIATSFVISAVAVRRAVVEQQRRVASERVVAAEHWFGTTAETLQGSVRDYARWDDTWQFLHGERPGYESDSFTAESWDNLDLDAVLVGRPGALILAGQRRVVGGATQVVPAGPAVLGAMEPLLREPTERVGLVQIEGEPWLYAAEPVTRSDGTGGDASVWVSARRLDAARLEGAEQLAGGALSLFPTTSPPPPPGPGSGQAAVRSLALGPGFEGWSARLVRHETAGPRVWSQLTLVAANTAALGLVVIIAALLLLDKMVFARLARFGEQAARIRGGASDSRLTVAGTDELDELASAVNGLLDADAASQTRLRYDALHDPLTGLANRALLLDRLGAALSRVRRSPDVRAALLFIDLDRMKRINDHLGHAVGDRFIAEVARRLSLQVRGSDTVARLGGDEFAVVLEDVASFDVAVSRARALLAAVRVPLLEAGHSYDLTASVGITVLRPESTEADLLKEADTAMYAAKQAGRDGWSIYDEAMHGRVTQRLATEQALREALKGPNFSVHFQPVVDMASGALLGFEALSRWVDPVRGVIAPDEFIAVAEDGPLIAELDAEVLERALAAFAPWVARLPGLFLCLNHSARRFESPELIPEIASALGRHGLPGSALVLEVTETQFGKSEDRWRDRIETLASLGVRVALDDFGTGYSSLVRLRAVPVAMLKLDRTFVEDLVAGNEAVAVAILQLASALSLPVIGEGVESASAAARLAELGCQYGQGWHFGRPVPAEEAGELVELAAAARSAAS